MSEGRFWTRAQPTPPPPSLQPSVMVILIGWGSRFTGGTAPDWLIDRDQNWRRKRRSWVRKSMMSRLCSQTTSACRGRGGRRTRTRLLCNRERGVATATVGDVTAATTAEDTQVRLQLSVSAYVWFYRCVCVLADWALHAGRGEWGEEEQGVSGNPISSPGKVGLTAYLSECSQTRPAGSAVFQSWSFRPVKVLIRASAAAAEPLSSS